MILDFYFVVGSHFRFPGLVFCSEFGVTLLDGFVFCRPLFSTNSPVSTLAPNEQGDYIYIYIMLYYILLYYIMLYYIIFYYIIYHFPWRWLAKAILSSDPAVHTMRPPQL